VGLFVWGTLVLLPIPFVAAAVIYGLVWDPRLRGGWDGAVFGMACILFLLGLGLSPVNTARRMQRGDLRGARTWSILVALATGGLLLLCMFVALLACKDGVMSRLIVAFVCLLGLGGMTVVALWLRSSLHGILEVAGQTTKTVESLRSTEVPHA